MNDKARISLGERWLDYFHPHRHNRPTGVISDKFRCVYLPIPKVANKSLKRWLMDHGAFRETDYERLVGNVSAETRPVTKSSIPPGFFVFAFVRNPWERLVSCFCDKIRESRVNNRWMKQGVYNGFVQYGVFSSGMTFGDFVGAVASIPDRDADVHFRSQNCFLIDCHDKWLPDYLGRTETLAEDIRKISEILRLPCEVPFPHLNKVARAPYREFYTPALVTRVRRRYERDIKQFNYEF